jgi:hypothetical protein
MHDWTRRMVGIIGVRLLASVGLLTSVGLLASVGCAPAGPTKYPISGTVTYKGQPVPAGNLHFDPDPRTNPKGVPVTLSITNGVYASAPGQGLLPGDYLVRVQAFDGKAANEAPLGEALCPEQTRPHTQPAGSTTLEITLP